MENEQQKKSYGYGKRPLWQWVVIYLVIGGLAYAAIYYFVFSKKDGGYQYGGSTNQQENVETAALFAVGNYTGSGTATRSFNSTTFYHSVKAVLSDPSEGKFYEGWLVKNPATKEFFSTGRMIQQGGEYALTFSAPRDYPEHKTVVITEETEALGLDGIPEAHVLEGSF